MAEQAFSIEGVVEGRNSVLFRIPERSILYEKLANTVHSGTRSQMEDLQKRVESVDYHPTFESGSLKKKREKELEGLVLNVTESCNFNCAYCLYSGIYQGERTENGSRMSFETARKAIDLFLPRAESPALVSFYGGEPLNNMNLIEKVIAYARTAHPNKKALFSMTTNFYDADRHFETIVGNDMYVVVSLDGPKEIHDKNRLHKSGKPTWEKVMDNLRKLEEYSPGYVKSHVGESITCADPEDLLEIIEFFKDEKMFNPFRIGGVEVKGLTKEHYSSLDASPTYELAGELLHDVKEGRLPTVIRLFFEGGLKMIAQRSREKMPAELPLYGSCYPGGRKMFVDTDGEIYICEKMGDRLPIGNVEEGVSEDIVNNAIDRFAEIRNQKCGDCWAQRVCTPCIYSAKEPEGDISLKGLSQMCSHLKTDRLVSIGLYAEISKQNEKFFKDYIQLNNGSKNESRI